MPCNRIKKGPFFLKTSTFWPLILENCVQSQKKKKILFFTFLWSHKCTTLVFKWPSGTCCQSSLYQMYSRNGYIKVLDAGGKPGTCSSWSSGTRGNIQEQVGTGKQCTYSSQDWESIPGLIGAKAKGLPLRNLLPKATYMGGSKIPCNHLFSLHMGAFIQSWQYLHQVWTFVFHAM